MPLGRLLVSVALMSAVLVLGFAALVLFGRLALEPAVLALVFLVLAQAALLRGLLGGPDTIRRGVEAMLRNPEQPPPVVRVADPAAGELWALITRLRRGLLERTVRLAAELEAANAVLASLPEPVLLINDRREVLRANTAACELFGTHLLGRDLSAAIRNPMVLSAADAVLHGAAAQLIEFELSVPVRRSLRARIERLADQPADGGAALVTLTDLTSLKRAEQMRADFVANASHELRTPLSTLIGFIETLEGPAAEDPEARGRFLPIMRQQAARMARLVDDLLSLSRIELNEHLPPRGEVDLAGVLRTVGQALDLKAAARGMRIELDFAVPPPSVLGDADELAQVFQNLIDNAIKYANEGTAVTISLAPSTKLRQGVAVAVRDRGEGIARRHLPRLTERFYRVDTARSRAMGGTGLGLAIVKHIISRHRGALEIESEAGEGSVFTVHLPSALAGRVGESEPLSAAMR